MQEWARERIQERCKSGQRENSGKRRALNRSMDLEDEENGLTWKMHEENGSVTGSTAVR